MELASRFHRSPPRLQGGRAPRTGRSRPAAACECGTLAAELAPFCSPYSQTKAASVVRRRSRDTPADNLHQAVPRAAAESCTALPYSQKAAAPVPPPPQRQKCPARATSPRAAPSRPRPWKRTRSRAPQGEQKALRASIPEHLKPEELFGRIASEDEADYVEGFAASAGCSYMHRAGPDG